MRKMRKKRKENKEKKEKEKKRKTKLESDCHEDNSKQSQQVEIEHNQE